ncbi:MAG: Cytoplasmic polyadenylation element-binding protein 1 [Marteilia pararefringens]
MSRVDENGLRSAEREVNDEQLYFIDYKPNDVIREQQPNDIHCENVGESGEELARSNDNLRDPDAFKKLPGLSNPNNSFVNRSRTRNSGGSRLKQSGALDNLRAFGQVLVGNNANESSVLSLDSSAMSTTMMNSNLDSNYLENSRVLCGDSLENQSQTEVNNRISSSSVIDNYHSNNNSTIIDDKQSSSNDYNESFESNQSLEIKIYNDGECQDNTRAQAEIGSKPDWRIVGQRKDSAKSVRRKSNTSWMKSVAQQNASSILSHQDSIQGLINFAISDTNIAQNLSLNCQTPRKPQNFDSNLIYIDNQPYFDNDGRNSVLNSNRHSNLQPNTPMIYNPGIVGNFFMPPALHSSVDSGRVEGPQSANAGECCCSQKHNSSSINDVLRQVMDMQVKVHKNIAQNPEKVTSCTWEGRCSDYQCESIQRAGESTVLPNADAAESSGEMNTLGRDGEVVINKDKQIDSRVMKERGKTFSRKVFAGGVPWEATEKSIAEAFVSTKHNNSSLKGVKSLVIEYPHRPSLSTSILNVSSEEGKSKEDIENWKPVSNSKNTSRRQSKITTNYFPGYVYLIFDQADLVNQAMNSCCVRQGEKYYFEIQTSSGSGGCNNNNNSNSNGGSYRGKKKQVEFVPFDLADAEWVSDKKEFFDYGDRRMLKNRSNTVFIGALHGQISARMLRAIMEDLFGEVQSVCLDLDKYNYPIGSGKVSFVSRSSLIKALEAGLVDVVTERFKKRIQIDPYLQSSGCCMCQKSNQMTYFCRNKSCFAYFCKDCWFWRHNAPSGDLIDDEELRTHIPLTR